MSKESKRTRRQFHTAQKAAILLTQRELRGD